MAVLNSDLFAGDSKLEACATTPSAHLMIGSTPGPHIGKLHAALERLRPGGPAIDAAEKAAMRYGPSTAEAVLQYTSTHVPPIVNLAYQTTPDKICGQMTIRAMDDDLVGKPTPGAGGNRQAILNQAFMESRASLRAALTHLKTLRADLQALPNSADPAFNAPMAALLIKHARNILVLSKRLKLPADPTHRAFRDALDRMIVLVEKNLAMKKTLLAAGRTGLCDPTHPRNAAGLPHAWSLASQPDPKTHLCEPFFTGDSRDLRRDVVTHEYFHLVGVPGDHAVNNTNDAFTNANSVAQVVAFLSDRYRQANSDGNERANPPLPSP